MTHFTKFTKCSFGYNKNNVVVRIKKFVFAHFICKHEAKDQYVLTENFEGIQVGCKKCNRVKFFSK